MTQKSGFFQKTHFGEANQPGEGFLYEQPKRFIDAQIYPDGTLHVSVDLWTHRMTAAGIEINDENWDDDALTNEMFTMEGPATKDSWAEAWRSARGLLNGKNIVFSDGSVVNRESYLAGVRA